MFKLFYFLSDVRVLPAIQCKSLRPGTNGTCACPNWLNCSTNSSSRVCIETSSGCRLLNNQCDLEQRKCQGEGKIYVNISTRNFTTICTGMKSSDIVHTNLNYIIWKLNK